MVARFAPDIALKIDQAFAILNAEGVTPIITDGFRTLADQTARYNASQSGASPYPAALPGTSIHEIGEGIDFGPNTNGAANFKKIVDAMQAVGLTWGQSFHDVVHFELFHTPSPKQIAACEREHP